jgi:hypothetical protein
MSGFEITCVNKNSSGLVVRIGGNDWSLGTHEAVVKIISKHLRLTILVDEDYFEVGVRGEDFAAYLVLEPDGFPLHNLNFPSC